MRAVDNDLDITSTQFEYIVSDSSHLVCSSMGEWPKNKISGDIWNCSTHSAI
jgi:hypothetical protein